jgi:hypothetical protein
MVHIPNALICKTLQFCAAFPCVVKKYVHRMASAQILSMSLLHSVHFQVVRLKTYSSMQYDASLAHKCMESMMASPKLTTLLFVHKARILLQCLSIKRWKPNHRVQVLKYYKCPYVSNLEDFASRFCIRLVYWNNGYQNKTFIKSPFYWSATHFDNKEHYWHYVSHCWLTS